MIKDKNLPSFKAATLATRREMSPSGNVASQL